MIEERGPWKILSKKNVYENPWITVEHHEVLTPTKTSGVYGTVHYKNLAIAVLPIDDQGYTWVVGQYRFPLKIYSWEIPEGGCPFGEDPVHAAQRELREETGLIATKFEPILKMHLSNAVGDEASISYLATGISLGKSAPEETEKIDVKRVPFKTLLEMVLKGEITDALTVATVLKYHSSSNLLT